MWSAWTSGGKTGGYDTDIDKDLPGILKNALFVASNTALNSPPETTMQQKRRSRSTQKRSSSICQRIRSCIPGSEYRQIPRSRTCLSTIQKSHRPTNSRSRQSSRPAMLARICASPLPPLCIFDGYWLLWCQISSKPPCSSHRQDQLEQDALSYTYTHINPIPFKKPPVMAIWSPYRMILTEQDNRTEKHRRYVLM